MNFSNFPAVIFTIGISSFNVTFQQENEIPNNVGQDSCWNHVRSFVRDITISKFICKYVNMLDLILAKAHFHTDNYISHLVIGGYFAVFGISVLPKIMLSYIYKICVRNK